ncbi:hypothetical protein COCON_G00230270 [Conger conger]|uniref:Uncharacterized protein n=1 Tax=Conger conger TaxID=82655 RepID=A0A9Q1HN08_CONCO|nr:hypothetical protein COCON_G00230270 [Conger conger]
MYTVGIELTISEFAGPEHLPIQPLLSLGTTSPSPFKTFSPPPLGTTNVAQVQRSGIRTSNLYLLSEMKKVRPRKLGKNKRRN